MKLIAEVFVLHKAFKEGGDLLHASRSTTAVNNDNILKVKETVLEYRRVGSSEIA